MNLKHLGGLFSRLLAMTMLIGWGAVAAANGAVADVSGTPVATLPNSTQVTSEFPAGATFSARIPLDQAMHVDSASLYYRIGNDDTLNLSMVPSDSVVVDDAGVNVSLFVDLQTAYIPLGVSLTYFWELSGGGDVVLVTEDESTLWIDTRFDWNLSTSDQVMLYTYDTSDDFARSMLDATQAMIDDLEQRYGLENIAPVAIWIYPDAKDFAGTRQTNTRETVAGISFPGASVIACRIPDGNEREFGRVMPHEISHLMLFHATDNPYAPPPLWLDEGLATHYQSGGTSQFAGMVWRANEQGTLFDINALSASFPFQPAQATLAYASSWSMVTYIETTYGSEGISRLIEAFGEGRPADDAIQRALGVSSAELNANWHQWVAEEGNPSEEAA